MTEAYKAQLIEILLRKDIEEVFLQSSLDGGVVYYALVSILRRIAVVASIFATAFVLLGYPSKCLAEQRKQTLRDFLIACDILHKQFVLALASAAWLAPTVR